MPSDAPPHSPTSHDARSLTDARLLAPQGPYGDFADRLLASCLVKDPWIDGAPRFHPAPLVLAPALRDRLYDAASRLGAAFDALVALVAAEPALLDDFFGLTPWQKLMVLGSDAWWHGFARVDLFVCEDGRLQACEINADTPSGQVEATLLGALFAPEHPALEDPNADYPERLWRMMTRAFQARTGRPGAPTRIGIVFPSDLPEDITLVRLYQRWFQERGAQVVLGSPFNLGVADDGAVTLLGRPVELVFRHYKTDWWAEREPVWADEPPYADPDPIADQLALLIAAEREGRVAVVNPFGALLPQDKRALALFWEHLDRFAPEVQATVRALIPETRRLDAVGRERLSAERERWVLKAAWGCEGDDVLVGPFMTQEAWDKALRLALEGPWVAQRFFRVAPVRSDADADAGALWLPNLGVYLIAGAPSGMLVRLTSPRTVTDTRALVAPVLVGAPTGAFDEAP